VALPRPVDGWGCYKLVSEHGYNTEPGWAMLVEVEAKVSKELLSKWTKFKFRAQGFNTEPGWVG
jgi:hypothetical protein